MKEELTIVKDDLVSVTKSVQTGMKKEVKSYAETVRSNQKEVMQAATAPAIVKDICRTINIEDIERQKKRKNVIVSNVPEPPSNITGEQKREHDIKYLCSDKLSMDPNAFITCFRAGKLKKDENGVLIPRPLVVVCKKEEDAIFWHNEGKGYRVGPHWINEDLCRSDREARFFLRQQRRNRQKNLQDLQKSQM